MFNSDKILAEYDTMSKEDIIDLLGDDYSETLKQRLNEGNIDFKEFTQICDEAFPDSPQQANWVRNMIFYKLSKIEGFNLMESDPQKRSDYAKI